MNSHGEEKCADSLSTTGFELETPIILLSASLTFSSIKIPTIKFFRGLWSTNIKEYMYCSKAGIGVFHVVLPY